MHKKFMLACMAIAAFAAFVVAPSASASPVLTDLQPIEGGEALKALSVGASIKATNTGITKFTLVKGGSAVECTHAEFKGTVTRNDGSVIEGKIEKSNFGENYTFSGTAASGDCTSSLGAVKPTLTSALCMNTVKGTDNINITGCTGNVTFTLDVTGVTSCSYSAASVTGTFTTGKDATVEVSEQPAALSAPNIFCPNEGWLDMDFDLTTTNGATILVS